MKHLVSFCLALLTEVITLKNSIAIMFAYLIAATVLPALIMGYPTTPCLGAAGQPPLALRIPGCETSPCSVQSGSILTYEADIFNPTNTSTVHVAAFITLFGVRAQVPLDNDDGCTKLLGASQCPLQAGAVNTFHEEVQVPQISFGIPFSVEVVLTNDAGEINSCACLHASLFN